MSCCPCRLQPARPKAQTNANHNAMCFLIGITCLSNCISIYLILFDLDGKISGTFHTTPKL